MAPTTGLPPKLRVALPKKLPQKGWVGGQNNLSLSPAIPLRALRPGGGAGTATEIDRSVSAKLWRRGVFRRALSRASAPQGRLNPERCTGSGVSPPCRLPPHGHVYSPFLPRKPFWLSVGLPAHRTTPPVLPRGIWSPACGAPPIRPSQHTFPSVGPSIVLLNVPPFPRVFTQPC